MNPEKRREIIKVLVQRMPNISCPLCHGKTFSIADGYVMDQLQEDYNSLVISGEKLIPSIYMICNNCGFMSQHALGVLGLINQESIKEEDNNSGM